MVVKRALEGLKGVSRADVSFRAREARVVFDPTQVSVEEMVDAVKRIGFAASVKREAAGEGVPSGKESTR